MDQLQEEGFKMAKAASLTKDFRIVERRSNTHCVLSNRYGKKKFLKYPRNADRSMLIELLNEVIVDRIHEKIGLNSVKVFFENVDGRLGLIEDYYPTNWNHVNANPNLEVKNKELFGRLLVAELLVRQTDRAPSKLEHIGVEEKNGVIAWVPIDNGHSLKGWNKEYTGLDEDLNVQFISNLFSSTQIDSFEEVRKGINIVETLDFAEIVAEATQELYSKSEIWTDDARDYYEAYGEEVILFLGTRREKIEAVLVEWWNQKQNIIQGGEN